MPGLVSVALKDGAGNSRSTSLWSSDGTVDGDLYAPHINLHPTDLTPLDPDAAVPVVGEAADYETVAASQTDQMLGATGAAGDRLDRLLVIPASTSPGAVSIEDGSTNTTVFAGGSGSVTTLHPFTIHLGIASVSGGWEITTGANVSVIAFGNFT